MDLGELMQQIDVDDLARRSVRRVRRELPQYGAVDSAEHSAAIRKQLQNQLDALAAETSVSEEALQEARTLATTRARQHVPIETLIGAHLLGTQMIWDAVSRDADSSETQRLLPRAATLLLECLHDITTVLAAAHAEASQVLSSQRITASQRLIDLLSSGQVTSEAVAHAEVLGFDSRLGYVAMVCGNRSRPVTLSQRALALLDETGPFVVGQTSSETVVICQIETPSDLRDIAERTLREVNTGIGLHHFGLNGAAQSLADARLALAFIKPEAPEGHRTALLEDIWVDACVQRESRRLSSVLAPAQHVATAHPHLADAVTTFATSDMQLTRAAVALHLHPNSVSYRLNRWADLTGWDPRTFDGLRKSLAAIASQLEAPGADPRGVASP